MRQPESHQKILYTRADLRRLGITFSNATLLRQEAAGRFPRRIYLSPASVAWVSAEIHAHIQSKIADRDGGEPTP
ncbi:helix-turn-helix transcriptional regulator [Pelagibacterium halotolerans]|uniref:helix-turn-helix transcriptional regulator n=1 Tax=Pelagibacterium halotolerans TaxID=531813 RepID=UPI003850F31E